jgi:hypothetical protein
MLHCSMEKMGYISPLSVYYRARMTARALSLERSYGISLEQIIFQSCTVDHAIGCIALTRMMNFAP